MLEFICAIPDSIGWRMVGFTEALCIIAAFRLGKIFFEMWKDRHEDF